MQRQHSIYDFPDIYDAVLRAPLEQIEAEVQSVRRLLAGRGIIKGRILELACGTCAHGILLSQQGFSVTGIDLSSRMLEGARQRAEAAGIEVELFQGDVVDFTLGSEPFDCAIFMAETFPLITEYESIVRHFRSVSRHLKEGGIYVVDIDSHKHGVCTTCGVWGERTVRLKNGWVEVWHEDFPGDWVCGTNHLVMHCRIHLDDAVYETADEWRCRVDSPWNLAVLAETLPDWSLTGFFAWRDLSQDIGEEEHFLMVLEHHRRK
jgi:SAM-dependent methyltransferase